MEGTEVGPYRLLRQIGAGGMGAVWLAEHTMLGRRAAVKVLHGEFTSRPEIVQRFFNEARAATAISDPGIVQVFDFGRHSDGSAYIVMELLDGEGLDRRIRDHGPMHPSDALRIIRQIAKSLGAAHTVGIVHRDLKPENIFLVRDEEVAGGERAKILDFGIAKLQGDTAGWRTNTSQVMGTPLYMSPEQCRGAGAVDQRTDIYSLGCMLFVMLCGRPPFWAEGSGELIAMHLREAPPTASSLNVRVPPEVDRLIARCLAKDPAERFLNGTEMANAVNELIAHLSKAPHAVVTQPPVQTDAQLGRPTATTLSSSSGAVAAAAATSPAPTSSKKLAWPAIAGGAVVLVVIVGIVMKNRNPPPTTSPAPEPKVEAQPAPPPPAPAVVQGSAPPTPASAPSPTVDRHSELTTRMLQVANGFLRWSATHAGAPCPTPKDVGVTSGDPWGHALRITCSDQPANQMIGIISDGPDGEAGTRDDVPSWTLPAEVTDAITGAKWSGRKAPSTPTTKTPKTTGTATHGPKDLDGDGIPDTL